MTLGVSHYPVLKTLSPGDWMLGSVPGQGGRPNRWTSGEILPAHVNRNEEKRSVDSSYV
jgi:hypothetical protein